MSELNYGRMMQRAMQSLMAEALGEVAEHGLPGDHHFYITFATDHPRAEAPDWLLAKVGDELTVVLQHQYADLVVTPEGFSVRLFFQGRPADLVVPFDAVKQFADPSAEFGLRFDPTNEDQDPMVEDVDSATHEASEAATQESPDADDAERDVEDAPAPPAGEVVSLDAFRKK